MEKERTVSQHR